MDFARFWLKPLGKPADRVNQAGSWKSVLQSHLVLFQVKNHINSKLLNKSLFVHFTSAQGIKEVQSFWLQQRTEQLLLTNSSNANCLLNFLGQAALDHLVDLAVYWTNTCAFLPVSWKINCKALLISGVYWCILYFHAHGSSMIHILNFKTNIFQAFSTRKYTPVGLIQTYSFPGRTF